MPKASELLVKINDELNELADIVNSSSLPPEDKKQFGQLMTQFNSFAENMTQPVGAEKPAPSPGGNVPVETAGKQSVPMGQMNKNAMPMM